MLFSLEPHELISLRIYDDSTNGSLIYNQNMTYLNSQREKYRIKYKEKSYYMLSKHVSICVALTNKLNDQDVYDIKLKYNESQESFDNFMKLIYGLSAEIDTAQAPEIYMLIYEMDLKIKNDFIDFETFYKRLERLILTNINQDNFLILLEIALKNQRDNFVESLIEKIKTLGWRNIFKKEIIQNVDQAIFEKLMVAHAQEKKLMVAYGANNHPNNMKGNISNMNNNHNEDRNNDRNSNDNKVLDELLNVQETFELISFYVAMKLNNDINIRKKYNRDYIVYTPNDNSTFWFELWEMSVNTGIEINNRLDQSQQDIQNLNVKSKEIDKKISELFEKSNKIEKRLKDFQEKFNKSADV